MASVIQESVFYSSEFHGQSDSGQGPAPVAFRKTPAEQVWFFGSITVASSEGKLTLVYALLSD